MREWFWVHFKTSFGDSFGGSFRGSFGGSFGGLLKVAFPGCDPRLDKATKVTVNTVPDVCAEPVTSKVQVQRFCVVFLP